MPNVMKNRMLLWLLLACSLAVSCGKEESRDYRDAWVGEYGYTCHKYSWNPRGSGPESYTDGTLRVSAEEDSCVGITLLEESKNWLCKVDASGVFSLIGNEYRVFNGRFFAADSMYFYCSNFSPGAGTCWEYECKRSY